MDDLNGLVGKKRWDKKDCGLGGGLKDTWRVSRYNAKAAIIYLREGWVVLSDPWGGGGAGSKGASGVSP